MVKNFFKTAIRYFLKHKTFFGINIIGLSVSIALCILVILFALNELSYDNFQKEKDKIFLTYTLGNKSSKGDYYSNTPPCLAPVLSENIPEIMHTARVFGWGVVEGIPVEYGDKVFSLSGMYADQAFFNIFSFQIVAGYTQNALENPKNVIISKSAAEKYFKGESPIGKVVIIRSAGDNTDFTIVGIVDIPQNSSIQFELMLSYKLKDSQKYVGQWRANNVLTFVKTKNAVDKKELENKFGSFFLKYFNKEDDAFGVGNRELRLISLKDLYLSDFLVNPITKQSSLGYSYILFSIALAILLIACVNYINLSIGLSSTRLKELSLRKVVGAARSNIILQFICEGVLLSVIAALIGVFLAWLFLPEFNNLAKRNILFDLNSIWLPLLAIIVFIGIVASSYPAFVLSNFHPMDILRQRLRITGNSIVSRVLIVVQFVLSVFLITSTIIMSRQMNYMEKKDLGFNKDQVIVLDGGAFSTGLDEDDLRKLTARYRESMLVNGDIQNVTMTNMSFGAKDLWGFNLNIGGNQILINTCAVNYDYAKTLGIKVINGRDFSSEYKTDSENSVLVNESFVRVFNMKDPVGMEVSTLTPDLKGKIVGVLEDSHLKSLHYKIEPAIYYNYPVNGPYRYIFVKISKNNIPETIAYLRSIWQNITPQQPFDFTFLDAKVDSVFKEDARWLNVTEYASLIAIVIACMGIFGLTSLAITKRTKEIGIRKVLGASVGDILSLLSKEMIMLVLAGNLVAWPIAYFVMKNWLQDFVYRTEISLIAFIIAGIIAFFIAFASVSSVTIKAALSNPVKSIRYE